jgi:hypothetical protein
MSLEPTIGSIGCATANTGRAPPAALEPAVPLAQPASAAKAADGACRQHFSTIHHLSPRCLDAVPRSRATLAPMILRSWFFAYFAFSHRSADGEAIA